VTVGSGRVLGERERLIEKGATEREGSTRGDGARIRILMETCEG
jgi:hypothetical protein